MLFKIPREIERRFVEKGMELYDYVVGAFPNGLRILKREENEVWRTDVPYSDIEGICLTRKFLSGKLALYLKTGQVAVPFNAVSLNLMRRFVRLIRERHAETAPAQSGNGIAFNLDTTHSESPDPFSINMMEELRRDNESILGYAFQPGMSSVIEDSNPITNTKSRTALHILTTKDLIVVQQEPEQKGDPSEEFHYYLFYFPLSDMKGVKIGSDGAGKAVTVALSQHQFQFGFDSGNTTVQSFYQSLATYINK